MKTKIYKGEKIREFIPVNYLENVKLSFQDHGMNFEKDLQYCDLHITSKGTCWIHDIRNKRWNWNGSLIATFTEDGSSFFFTKNSDRNSKRLNDYQNARIEFFGKARTAREVGEFEKQYIFS